MGYYIQTPNINGKVEYLKKTYHAKETFQPSITLNEISEEGMALVCVIDNGSFEAAGYIYSDLELRRSLPTKRDNRKRTWLLMDEELVRKLSNYNGNI